MIEWKDLNPTKPAKPAPKKKAPAKQSKKKSAK